MKMAVEINADRCPLTSTISPLWLPLIQANDLNGESYESPSLVKPHGGCPMLLTFSKRSWPIKSKARAIVSVQEAKDTLKTK